MAAGTAPPPPPGRRVRRKRTRRAGSEGRRGIRQRGKSGGCRRADCRAVDDRGRSLRRGGSHRFPGQILVIVANLAWLRQTYVHGENQAEPIFPSCTALLAYTGPFGALQANSHEEQSRRVPGVDEVYKPAAVDPIKKRNIGSHFQSGSRVEIIATTDDYLTRPAGGRHAKTLAGAQDCVPLHIAKNDLYSEPDCGRIELLLARPALLALKHQSIQQSTLY